MLQGDVTLSAEDRHPLGSHAKPLPDNYTPPFQTFGHDGYDEDGEDEDEEYDHDPHASFFTMVGHSQAFKFLLAGGLAGAVSRTATAPFDRLKVFLITRSELTILAGDAPVTTQSLRGLKIITGAVSELYAEAGLKAFWVGNGLNVVKIFPVTLQNTSSGVLALNEFKIGIGY